MSRVRVDLLTREYPPDVYGGAGVHVEYLARELRALVDVRVHCFGAPARRAGCHGVRRPGRRWTAPTPRCAPSGVDLAMAAGLRRRGPGALPHLVRQPRRPPRQAAARRPARGDRALPGAAAALEGRAARRRLRAVHLGRAHRDRGRRRGDRRVRRHARRHPALLPDVDPDRVHVVHNGIDTERVPARPRHRRARAPRHRPGPARRRLRRPDHPAEGPAAPAAGGAAQLPAGRSSCCCAGAPGHPGDRGRVHGARRRAARAPRRACSGSSEMLPRPR